MSLKKIILPALAALILFNLPQPGFARNGIMSDWISHYNPCDPLVTADCSACHQNGFDFNPYGDALKTRIGDLNMDNVAAFVDAESVDSDGDGFTNGQEIVIDCTFPGDNSSFGTVADIPVTWESIKALYR